LHPYFTTNLIITEKKTQKDSHCPTSSILFKQKCYKIAFIRITPTDKSNKTNFDRTETEGGVSQSPPVASCPSPSKSKTSIFKQKTSILGSAILGSPKNDSSSASLSSNKTPSATMPLSEKPKSPSDAFDCKSLTNVLIKNVCFCRRSFHFNVLFVD